MKTNSHLFQKIWRQRNKNIHLAQCRFKSSQYVASSFPDVEINKDNVAKYIMKDFGKWPQKVAVECSMTGKKYTFDDLRIKSENFGWSLLKLIGLKAGDMVAIVLPNSPQFVVSTLGILLSGLKLTTINPIYTPDEIQRQLVDSNTKAIVTSNSVLHNVQKAIQNGHLNIPIILATSTQAESIPNGVVKYEELVNTKRSHLPRVNIDDKDFVFLPYSSGTTGIPKGVMLSNSNLNVNIAQFQAFGCIEETTETSQDVLAGILPMFHIYGFAVCTALVLQKGVKLVTLPKFSPNLFMKVLKEHHPTILKVVPPLVLFLNSHPEAKSEHLRSVRYMLCAAAPLEKSDAEKFRIKVNRPIKIIHAYGMTEASPGVTYTKLSNAGRYPGSVGELMPNTLAKVVNTDDPQERHLKPQQIGELLVKGPQVMLGYYNKPEETKKTITKDGWLRTGDMLRYDEHGMFYIVDRIKDLIKVKGFQVAPAELEEIIRMFPGVAEAAVIGISDEHSGEIPRAYVVPKQGNEVNAEKLRKFVDDKVAPYKTIAGGVVVIPEIPKDPSGKILRRQLRLLYQEKGI